MSGEPLRWGILGARARVARRALVPAIVASRCHVIAASASRRYPGDESSYTALLSDPAVEVVYVPLPHALHRPWVERALEAGKHVVCETPMAMGHHDAVSMFAAADSAQRILLEAYMTPFHPRSERFEALIGEGRLGRVRFAHASFTFALGDPADHRLDPSLSGGASLDLGIFCVAPMLLVFGGPPNTVTANAVRNDGGVDTTIAGFFDFGAGHTGSFECSFDARARQVIDVIGTAGSVRLEPAFLPWLHDDSVTVRDVDGTTETIPCGGANPYRRMIDHFWSVIREGAPPRHGQRETLAVAELLDAVRTAAAP